MGNALYMKADTDRVALAAVAEAGIVAVGEWIKGTYPEKPGWYPASHGKLMSRWRWFNGSRWSCVAFPGCSRAQLRDAWAHITISDPRNIYWTNWTVDESKL